MSIGRTVIVVLLVAIMLGVGNVPAFTRDFFKPAAVELTRWEQGEINKPQVKQVSNRDLRCLADNIYYEAANQPLDGRMAVAFVTMNRLMDVDYPNSVCSVVYEKRHPIYCQFSWVCERPTRFEPKAWQEALTIARVVVEEYQTGYHKLSDPSHGALFFHTTEVSPKWKTAFTQTAQIADHIFYRK